MTDKAKSFITQYYLYNSKDKPGQIMVRLYADPDNLLKAFGRWENLFGKTWLVSFTTDEEVEKVLSNPNIESIQVVANKPFHSTAGPYMHEHLG